MKPLETVRANRIAEHKKKKSALEQFDPNLQRDARFRAETKLWRLQEETELPIFIQYHDTITIKGYGGNDDLVLNTTGHSYYLVDFDTLASSSFNCTRNEIHLPSNALDLSDVPHFEQLDENQVVEELRTLVDELLRTKKPKTWKQLKEMLADHYHI